MSTIYDRAVRALQSVLGDATASGEPLAYCCAPGCLHQACRAVGALAEAGLLAYADTVHPTSPAEEIWRMAEESDEAITNLRERIARTHVSDDQYIDLAVQIGREMALARRLRKRAEELAEGVPL